MNPLFKPPAVLIAFAACILMTIVMGIQGKPLQTTLAPKGIVSLEFASNASAASHIKNEWLNTPHNYSSVYQVALNNTLIDFIYISAYGLFFILLCLRSSEIVPHKKLMKSAAFMAFAAAIADVLENLGMLYTLQREALQLITLFTSIAAGIKFSLLFIVLILLAFCWGKKWLQKNEKVYN